MPAAPDPSDHEPLISEISHGWTRSRCRKASWLHGAAHVHVGFFRNRCVARLRSRSWETVVISGNDARQGAPGHELLYVLGFGTTGAIFAVAAVLAYFELFRAWG